MDAIVHQIQSLQGVQEVSIYREGSILASTLLVAKLEKLQLVFRLIEQLFTELRQLGKSHNELCFTFSSQLMLIYKLPNNCMVILITDKRVHKPMLQMGVKAATRHIDFSVSD